MLVAISDLHLLDETAGRHNPSSTAFTNVFLPNLLALIRSKKAKDLRILLLGDTFDLIRTEQWLESEPDDRPWGAGGLQDLRSPRAGGGTAAWCMKILGTAADESPTPETTPSISSRNPATLRFFQDLPGRIREEIGQDFPVEVIYLPGNHDRLCNLYPEVRDRVREMLGVTVRTGTVAGDPSGEWWFLNDYTDSEHGLFARHGHQFDSWNFAGGTDFSRQGHLQVPIGDLLAIEFGTKLPYRLGLFREEEPEITVEIVDFMKELGLVRPFTHALQWLTYAIRNQPSPRVREVVNEVFDGVFREILDIDFVKGWRNPDTRKDDILRLMSSRWMNWLPRTVLKRFDAEDILPFFAGVGHSPRDPAHDPHLLAAFNEPAWRADRRIQFVLYGHTHFPMQRPLDAEDDHEVIYINTGTWRDSIFRTTEHDVDPDFMKLGQLCYSVFYRADEDTDEKPAGAVSFETWAGTRKIMRRSRRHGLTVPT
jgi:UDP-2,3-diacylglucosamine pyrophosphatase LpxH